jgi:hypothetical protein
VLTRHEEPHLRHVVDPTAWPAGTVEVAAVLDELEVALDATVSNAQAALKAAGDARRRSVVSAALRQRRQRP